MFIIDMQIHVIWSQYLPNFLKIFIDNNSQFDIRVPTLYNLLILVIVGNDVEPHLKVFSTQSKTIIVCKSYKRPKVKILVL